jgi:hypothetical protein
MKKLIDSNLNADLKFNVTIEPNPTTDIVKVTIDNANGNVEVKLFNLLGQLLSNAVLKNDDREAVLSLGGKMSGIYIVQVKDDNGMLSRKVIKE